LVPALFPKSPSKVEAQLAGVLAGGDRVFAPRRECPETHAGEFYKRAPSGAPFLHCYRSRWEAA
ncbi:hypothetical protein, partial [Pseudophaeobacter sp.]|uniref:hypothetical protein n=1 Tax=Pseudophaeobacter sp. TaxID=1971739 RepID=UPI0032986A9E